MITSRNWSQMVLATLLTTNMVSSETLSDQSEATDRTARPCPLVSHVLSANPWHAPLGLHVPDPILSPETLQYHLGCHIITLVTRC